MKNINLRTVLVSLTLGLVLGWLFFGGSPEPSPDAGHQHATEAADTVWTCSMHPQIRMDEPGQCPICGMDLIPLDSGEEEELSASEVQMSRAAMGIARLETETVQLSAPFKEVYFPGKVKADERRIVHLTARFGGRIERLFVNFTGQRVRKGEKLLEIYSPDLVTAQKELFEALRYRESRPAFYRAARNKLRLWDLTEEQITAIETSGEVRYYFDVVSPIDGTVTKRHVAEGHYTMQGSDLLEVTDLSRVWVQFDAYESDLPWIQVGDRIDFTIRSLPAQTFTSTVTFIDPVVHPDTRVALVRTELRNDDDLLKPEMFANGVLKTMLPRAEEALTVPKSAVLWTGKRAIVYVAVPGKTGVFEHREIELGEDAGGTYVVTAGLRAGEEVVTNGVFKVDAAAQLSSKESMMTPAGGPAPTGHAGHGGASAPAPSAGADEHADHAGTVPTAESADLDPELERQVLKFLDTYLELKDALTRDAHDEASAAATAARESLDAVEMSRIRDESRHMAWMRAVEPMGNALVGIADATKITDQRVAFSNLSNQLLDSLKALGITPETDLYLQFCPMALDNQGAFWLSQDEAIRNPYLGASMLACGEVTESFAP